MEYEKALVPLLQAEGGFVDDPDDSGGATNFGITQAVYDRYRRSKGLKERSVKVISQEEVSEIYYTNYWIKAKCHKLPDKLDLVHFDSAVNHGVGQAGKLLQGCVGAKVDGVIGPKTLLAISKVPVNKVVIRYVVSRYEFYGMLAKKPNQLKFLRQWMIRLRHLLEEVGLS